MKSKHVLGWCWFCWIVFAAGSMFAEEAKVLAAGDDSSCWKWGCSDRNKLSVAVDNSVKYGGSPSTKVSFDLQPGKDGQWYFFNIPLHPQVNDWTKAKAVSCTVRGDGSANKIRLVIKDAEGEILEQTEPIELSNQEWTVVVATLTEDGTGFRPNRYFQPNKDKIAHAGVIDKGGVEELQISVDDTWLEGRQGSFWISNVKLIL